ncbi:MAG: patatin [Flavobacterium sp.]|uniref:patatin-like phospholipase family protein n=1 Tax=unclassified Flavobacterium TaxID=196869 RepID=UPI000C3EF0DE|nr:MULTISPECIES: patatin-like phospholipase family protein [unclassified Flavobacterium]MBF02194.1 patatin [Flavobacterium sp.]MCO6163276.1 patatin-like phospholipase family protein [Flavobacterium sp. NRK F7]
MRALVISGGGSKGAFAGGVAQYLIEDLHKDYDLYLGTSTGSLLVSHLALQKVEKIKEIYTSVNQNSIFSNCPFIIKKRYGEDTIAINHFNVFRNFMKGSKTFGESKNLKKLIRKVFTEEEFEELKGGPKEIIVTVSNLSLNIVEYKSINDFSYDDFCDWIWISCNYIPFMSLVRKNSFEYADGGFASMIPIEEAIKRGATHVDAIILQSETNLYNRMPARGPFGLLSNLFAFMMDRIEYQNIKIGKYEAKLNNATINFYFTPTLLTTNSLVFNKKQMLEWWKIGYEYAKTKEIDRQEIPDEE